jgi:hypothetical protein
MSKIDAKGYHARVKKIQEQSKPKAPSILKKGTHE